MLIKRDIWKSDQTNFLPFLASLDWDHDHSNNQNLPLHHFESSFIADAMYFSNNTYYNIRYVFSRTYMGGCFTSAAWCNNFFVFVEDSLSLMKPPSRSQQTPWKALELGLNTLVAINNSDPMESLGVEDLGGSPHQVVPSWWQRRWHGLKQDKVSSRNQIWCALGLLILWSRMI